MNGWRILTISQNQKLSTGDNQLIITGEDNTVSMPLDTLREIIITSRAATVTSSLIARLAEEGIGLTFCDEKFLPCSGCLPLNRHHETAGCLFDQIEWSQPRKDEMWGRIVQDKIRMQTTLLSLLGAPRDMALMQYYADVLPGDPTNREGLAAKLYFGCLFGSSYARWDESPVTAAQNYGYAIITSAMSRTVVGYGYNTALGIHHCSRENPWNLSCDLIEPFRPFVDEIVYKNYGRELDWGFKQQLIGVLHADCLYGSRSTIVENAMSMWALDVLKALKEPAHKVEVLSFER